MKTSLKERVSSRLCGTDAFFVWVASASIIASTLVAFSHFNAWITVIGSLFLTALYAFFGSNIKQEKIFGLGIGSALLCACILRIKPFLYTAGGQDQGYYVLMSKLFNTQGSINFVDSFRKSLQGNELAFFDLYNSSFAEGGFFLMSGKNSTYAAGFYPLHAIWMAIFGGVLGDQFRAYELVFWGLISIYSVYRLMRVLFPEDKLAANLASWILAIMPLHVFFSRFPASEMPALGMTSTAFYFLARLWRRAGAGVKDRWAFVLSLVFFFSFFLTRLSGLLYVPFFFMLACLTPISDLARPMKKYMGIYWLSLLAIYLGSCYFYFYFYPATLFFPTFNDLLFKHLGPYPMTGTIAIIGGLLTLPILFARARITVFLVKYRRLGILSVFLGTIGFALWVLYCLRSGHPITKEGNVVHRLFLDSAAYLRLSPLTSLVSHFSPFGIFLLIIVIFKDSLFVRNKLLSLVICFFLLFFALHVIFNKYDYYYFYYMRFYLVEMIPAGAMIVGLVLANFLASEKRLYRNVGRFLIVSSFSWLLVPSVLQVELTEGPDARFFKDIQTTVLQDDLILEMRVPMVNESILPLKYFFQHDHILRISSLQDLERPEVRSILSNFKRVFLLTSDKVESNKVTLVKPLEFQYNFIFNGRSHLFMDFAHPEDFRVIKGKHIGLIPTQQMQRRLPINLYQIDEI